jgi:hypothetical protein
LETDQADANGEEDTHTSSNHTDAEEAEVYHDQGRTTDSETGAEQESADRTGSGGSEGVEQSDDPGEDETDSDGTNSSATEPIPAARMARRATTRKFERRPSFSGLDEEDVVDKGNICFVLLCL